MNVPRPTERLILREFVAEDWEQVHAYGSDPEVVRFMSWGPNTEEETQAYVPRQLEAQASDPRRELDFAVTLKDDGRLIGGCGLHVTRPKDPAGFIGYCFHRDYWGQGYAAEAARSVVAFGFEALDLHRIYSTCDVQNIASARVMEKVGMRREGHLREDRLIRGRWRDSLLYAILEHEWREQRT